MSRPSYAVTRHSGRAAPALCAVSLLALGLALPDPAWAEDFREYFLKSATAGSPAVAALAAAEPTLTPVTDRQTAPAFTEDDELILQLRTSRLVLGETVTGYGNRSGVYLPLGELGRLLDLAITIDPDGQAASGWFIREDRLFSLSLATGQARANDRQRQLGPGDAVALNGEIFVRTDVLAALLPLEFAINLSALQIQLTTLERFPFEERLDREAQRARLARGDRMRDVPPLPIEPTPYRFLTVPSVDLVTRIAYSELRGTEHQYDIRAAGDLALLGATLFLSGNETDSLASARLSLGRVDPDRRLLGPLRASRFEIGDTFTQRLEFGARTVGGRGISVSNTPLDQASIFDRLDLRGELPSGFDVELYRNNVLIGSSAGEARTGQYEFTDVPLEFGTNILRLVFFGPRGERREEVRQISVGAGQLAQGAFRYSLGATERDTSVFDVRDSRRTIEVASGTVEATALLEYGLTSSVTLSLAGQRFTRDNTEIDMGLFGVRTGVGPVSVDLQAGSQTNGGSVYQLGLGGSALGVGYVVKHAIYNDGFIDENQLLGTGTTLSSSTSVLLNGSFQLGNQSLPLTFRGQHVETAAGNTQLTASLRTGLTASGIRWSNTLDLQESSSGASRARQVGGVLEASPVSSGRNTIRGSLDYEVAPDIELRNVNLAWDRELAADTQLRLSAAYGLLDGETRIGASLSRQFRRYEVALDSFYDTRGDYSVALRFGISFGWDQRQNRPIIGRLGLGTTGSVVARVYRDLDGDGAFSPADAPVEGFGLLGGSDSDQPTTNEQGFATVTGLGAGRYAELRPDLGSVDDIYLRPTRVGVRVLPRPGRVHVTDVALLQTGDIEGSVLFVEGNVARPVSAVGLNIVNARNEIVGNVRSESDGFFLIEGLPAGTYQVEIDPEQAARLGLVLLAPVSATITPEGGAGTPVRVLLRRR